MNDQQWHDLEHIGEFAAGSYWLAKDRDPTETQRLGGSAYVRNNAEYAGVAAGQMSIAHLLWLVLAKLLIIPFWIGSFVAIVGAPYFFGLHGSFGLQVAVTIGCICLWFYLCCWRLVIKPLFRWLMRKGPGITYADGYRGPLGTGETVYTHRQNVR